MKNLNQYIKESLLDDEETLVNNDDAINIQWVKDNYHIENGNYSSSADFTITNGVLNAKKLTFVANENLTQLTNGNFKFGEVNSFVCNLCRKLKSLEGGPTRTKQYFECVHCDSLKDLTGAPEFVGTDFDCSECKNLESLKGAPEYVSADFICSRCWKLKSLNHLPSHIGDDLYIDQRLQGFKPKSGQVGGEVLIVEV